MVIHLVHCDEPGEGKKGSVFHRDPNLIIFSLSGGDVEHAGRFQKKLLKEWGSIFYEVTVERELGIQILAEVPNSNQVGKEDIESGGFFRENFFHLVPCQTLCVSCVGREKQISVFSLRGGRGEIKEKDIARKRINL